jgi:sulfide:quinone oxidoreductase
VTAGLAEAGGWVRVDPRTLETRFPGVYAIGDVTAIPIGTNQALPKAGVFAHAEADVVAARIADGLAGQEPTAAFDGRGMCFLETGHGRATMVSGDFFASPPDVALADATPANLEAKHAFEADRLAAWFGA